MKVDELEEKVTCRLLSLEEKKKKQVNGNMYNENNLNYTNTCINNSIISRLQYI